MLRTFRGEWAGVLLGGSKHAVSASCGAVAALLLLNACGKTASSADTGGEGGSSVQAVGGSGAGGASSSTTGEGGTPPEDTSTSSSTTGTVDEECESGGALVPKRLTRLTFPQLANAISSLFGSELAADLDSEFELPAANDRAFPPLADPGEGSVFVDSIWVSSDRIAQRVGQHVLDNFAALSGCDENDTACSEEYLYDVASEAYRRPLTGDDEESLGRLVSALLATDASAAELAQYGVYGILSSPEFLYRTEFGDQPEAAGALTQFELADQLAYFLTSAPPDAELRDLAERGELDEASLGAQAARLLTSATAQRALTGALYAYLGVSRLKTIVLDPASAPEFSDTVRESMEQEVERFLGGLWQPVPLDTLLLGRQSWVNQEVAAIYGVGFPPAGTSVDADGFALVDLPPERSGLLTMPGYLVVSSRPDVASLVLRGLRVMGDFTCDVTPPDPPIDDSFDLPTMGATQAENADIRAAEPVCAQCHDYFDPYGVALQHFGLVGEYRDVDEGGAPIDSVATLLDGQTVSGAVELANYLAESEAFDVCMSKAWLTYALPVVTETIEPCAAAAIAKSFRESPGSLSDLVLLVAKSPAFRERLAPGTQ